MTSQIRSCVEYLISTYSMLVLRRQKFVCRIDGFQYHFIDKMVTLLTIFRTILYMFQIRFLRAEMVIELTTPRGPVAAMFSGPGPSYGLPGLTGRQSHDPSSRFAKAPAYHFGSRFLNDQQTDGPGPCYMPQPKVISYTTTPLYYIPQKSVSCLQSVSEV